MTHQHSPLANSITEIGYSLHNIAYKFCKDRDVAEDIVQDTILKALINIDKYKEGTNLKGWVYTIMRNVFINEYRRKRRLHLMNSATEFDIFGPSHIQSHNEGGTLLETKEIQKEVDKVNNKHSLPFMLYFDGYKYEEISDMLKLPIGTVKNRIHLARKELRTRISTTQQYGMNHA